MKNSSPKSRFPDCPKKSCVFPNTCEWNQRCMQKGLELSVNAKMKVIEQAKVMSPGQDKPKTT
ncbi:MAG: hypothetical protein ACJZ7A_08875 [Opitutales bacterium]|nr:MAG: hypothetical protein CBC00_05110 [Verrucomicrobia bacterium TMED40]